MTGVEFKDQNCVFGKPPNMTEDECGSLPAKRTSNNGFPAVESVFELSDEEIELINKTKRIRLGVIGNTMQPVYLSVENENSGS